MLCLGWKTRRGSRAGHFRAIWLLASLSFFVYERPLTQSLEESINRREFRTPPNVPLKGRTPETEEAKQRARRVNRNRTIELVC
jgi:hypothetical protein